MSTRRDYKYLVKMLLIGDSGVGKSCLLLRFYDDNFTPSFITTIGIDFKVKKLNIDDIPVKLQIWDTAGQERFKTVTTSYYRGAMAILLVYDVCDEKSFENVKQWYQYIEDYANEDVEVTLVANKVDMSDKRVISTEKGQAMARDLNVPYIETSSKASINVEEAFTSIVKRFVDKQKDKNVDNNGGSNGINIEQGGSANGSSKCC
ncbi:ras-domain-containing protein [Nadsonia fulvescens var. elongata DSM 6958]|uniref:Ras-domain-containing protein n=1 Tax=Nadsonia fulvescens var. elongata DSM 6958 TaxID=857566 RepID=A0A1E3PED3_9ASCO|nr:ras-domain-containing protein [Nadsonia fulvescens var. elongata DSM 6958]